MSGHSKWATTKHKKAVIDARRGKMFAKLIKNIEVAARTGGGDLMSSDALRRRPEAKKSSVPTTTSTAPQARVGSGGGRGRHQTIMYEGYGPNGVAVLVMPDRQPQPGRLGGADRSLATAGRWPTPARFPVQPQGCRHRVQGRRHGRGRRAVCPRRQRRRSATSEAYKVVSRPPTWLPGPLCRGRHRHDSADASFIPRSRIDEDGAKSSSSRRSRTATTCRTVGQLRHVRRDHESVG
jgi:hypothetical protein